MLAALDQLGPERTGGFLPVTLDKVRQFVGNQDETPVRLIFMPSNG